MDRLLGCVGFMFVSLALTIPAANAQNSVSYNKDVRPVLASKCFPCHGPHEDRASKLRLDLRDEAIKAGALVPGSDKSPLVQRILSTDPDHRMPPPSSNSTLSSAQKEILRRWVQDGAHYEKHWSFVHPGRPALPVVKNSEWLRNGIDNFTLQRLERENLNPQGDADPYSLVRRVFLDLIGLPPTPQEADEFVHDESPDAYEKLVDRLLQSKHYGERWARQWLDLARYSDTNGYEKDRPRSMWLYRDWVIRALNDDKPFDEFSIEQLAGDMLPNSTIEQRIATGFHRNTMLNEEGGIDPLEYRFYSMVDRVATTGTVWMGLTTGCAQCHSHKYDPISHTDFYQFMALMNNADEPDLSVPTPELTEQRRSLMLQIANLERDLASEFPAIEGAGEELNRRSKNYRKSLDEWIKNQASSAIEWKIIRPDHLQSNLPRLQLQPDGSVFSSGDITKRDVYKLTVQVQKDDLPITALRLEVLPDDRLPARGPGRAYYEGRKGDFFLSEFTAQFNADPVRFQSASHTYGKISVGNGKPTATNVIDGDGSTGWSTAGREGESSQLVVNLSAPIRTEGKLTIELLFERHFAASLGRFRISSTSHGGELIARSVPPEIETLLATGAHSWNTEQQHQIAQFFNLVAPELSEPRKGIEMLRKQLVDLPVAMVLKERSSDNPRKTFRHHRGEYLSPREEVTAAVPAVFAQLNHDVPANRLALARWLVSDRNPLVGRVTVNRAWQAFFGSGLVETPGDFGTQADAPSHPELLDWLARELVENGWSIKRLHRLIVMSSTYRQDSRIRKELLLRDGDNRLLARGPRFRLNAEMVRDSVLKASGLLEPKMYGPGVYPPQPASVTSLAYGNSKWTPSTGVDRFRRSIYTFSKRTAPFAAFTVFDAPTGERCIARRDRSNTPLQALTLLNDEMYLEMARALAKRANLAFPDSVSGRVTWVFRSLLTRPPTPDELASLVEFVAAQELRCVRAELDAVRITHEKDGTPALAATVMLARAILNLDEAITKP